MWQHEIRYPGTGLNARGTQSASMTTTAAPVALIALSSICARHYEHTTALNSSLPGMILTLRRYFQCYDCLCYNNALETPYATLQDVCG